MRRGVVVLLAAGALAVAGCGGDDGNATVGGSTADEATTGETTAGGGAAGTTSVPTGTGTRSVVPTAELLAGREYLSTAIRGRRLVAGSQISLQFDGDSLAINADCNNILGGYAIAGERLRWATDPISTMIGCRADLQQQDTWLTDFFRGAGADVRLVEDQSTLVLARDGVELRLREGVASGGPGGQAPIVGTSWTLETIAEMGGDGSAASVPAGVTPPTLRFTTDDRAEVFTGCNSGGGRGVVREDGFAQLGPLTLTRKACDAAATATERAVTAILAGRVALARDGAGNLIVSKAGRQLVFRAG